MRFTVDFELTSDQIAELRSKHAHGHCVAVGHQNSGDQCPFCWAYADDANTKYASTKHEPDCAFDALLRGLGIVA